MIGTGLVIGGSRLLVPGRNVVNWHDDPRLRLKIPEDGKLRPKGVRLQSIGLHSTRGAPDSDDPRPQQLLPGMGPSTSAGVDVVADWNRDRRCAGAHIVIDHDTTIYCLADLVLEVAYHATSINDRSIGIEMKQGRNCEFYTGAIDALGDTVDAITLDIEIPRIIPDRYRGPVERLEAGGHDYYGVFVHRDQTDRRGVGDPGDFVFQELAARGYERFNLRAREDLAAVKARQEALGFVGAAADGLYGPRTFAALRRQGFRGGQWVLPPPGRAA